jgi:hypothetical protein
VSKVDSPFSWDKIMRPAQMLSQEIATSGQKAGGLHHG